MDFLSQGITETHDEGPLHLLPGALRIDDQAHILSVDNSLDLHFPGGPVNLHLRHRGHVGPGTDTARHPAALPARRSSPLPAEFLRSRFEHPPHPCVLEMGQPEFDWIFAEPRCHDVYLGFSGKRVGVRRRRPPWPCPKGVSTAGALPAPPEDLLVVR